MSFITVSASSTTPSAWIKVSTLSAKSKYTLALDFTTGSGVGTADVEFTLDEDLTSPLALTHDVLTAKTATTASDMYSPVSAFRLNLSAYTSGTVTLQVRQD
jgi:hypothetical protein